MTSDHGPYQNREQAQRSISYTRHAAGGTEEQAAADAIRTALDAAGVVISPYEQTLIDRLCVWAPLLGARMIDPPDAQVIAGWIRRAATTRDA